MLLTDLFYSSLVNLPASNSGEILESASIKINRKMSSGEKLEKLQEIKEKLRLSDTNWEKISKIDMENCNQSNDIFDALEKNIDKMLIDPKSIKMLEKIGSWCYNHPYIIISILTIGGIVIYLKREKLTEYVIGLGERVQEFVKVQIDMGKSIAILADNDIRMRVNNKTN